MKSVLTIYCLQFKADFELLKDMILLYDNKHPHMAVHTDEIFQNL